MITNQDINKLSEKLDKNNVDLKNTIAASKTRIILCIEELKSKILELERENSELKNKLEKVERNSKKKNIVIFGLEKQNNVCAESISLVLNKLLNINLVATDISDVYLLGKSPQCPIKVEFTSFQKVKLIFENRKNLKGTRVVISKDLTQKQQEEQKILRKHLLDIRKNSTENCYIRGSKLFINYKPHTVEQLELTRGTVYVPRPNSAPHTPCLSSVASEEVFEEKLEDSIEVKTTLNVGKGDTPRSRSTHTHEVGSTKPGNLAKNIITKPRLRSGNNKV